MSTCFLDRISAVLPPCLCTHVPASGVLPCPHTRCHAQKMTVSRLPPLCFVGTIRSPACSGKIVTTFLHDLDLLRHSSQQLASQEDVDDTRGRRRFGAFSSPHYRR